MKKQNRSARVFCSAFRVVALLLVCVGFAGQASADLLDSREIALQSQNKDLLKGD